jgi:beta-glucanase (GH16 family)
MNESYTSVMLRSQYRQEFIYELFFAKIRLPYGQGTWPAWRLIGNCDPYHLS